jgi:hypothetical protein
MREGIRLPDKRIKVLNCTAHVGHICRDTCFTFVFNSVIVCTKMFFNDYLSQDIYVLITTGYHEITNPRIYFFLTQSTNNVFLHQLLHIIMISWFGTTHKIHENWYTMNNDQSP